MDSYRLATIHSLIRVTFVYAFYPNEHLYSFHHRRRGYDASKFQWHFSDQQWLSLRRSTAAFLDIFLQVFPLFMLSFILLNWSKWSTFIFIFTLLLDHTNIFNARCYFGSLGRLLKKRQDNVSIMNAITEKEQPINRMPNAPERFWNDSRWLFGRSVLSRHWWALAKYFFFNCVTIPLDTISSILEK